MWKEGWILLNFKHFRWLYRGLCALVGIGFSLSPMKVSGQEQGVSSTFSSVTTQLTKGNRRFIAGHPQQPRHEAQRRQETVKYGQHPKAVILTCADSRVVPERLFDQGLGDLFTIRVAGNVANDDEVASVEYAAEHLHTTLVVVLGHTECGAVTAVVNGKLLPGRAFAHLTAPIRAAVAAARKTNPTLHGEGLISAAIKANVREAMADLLKNSEALRQLENEQRIRIVGAIYDLKTGQVRWLDESTH